MKKVSGGGTFELCWDFHEIFNVLEKFDGKFSTMKMRLARMTQFSS